MDSEPTSTKLKAATNRITDVLRSQKTWAAVDAWLARWGALAIMALAVFYYAQYYRSELNLGGEGGTTAVIAQRLMEGQLPFIDTYLGYNVMWFYPVVALFQLTGPDFVALRIYFFVLCTAIGVLGFLTVRRVTGIGWLSFAVGTMLILIPGMLFRNYMGLLPVLNGWALVGAFAATHASPRRQWIAYLVAGIVLGLTYLVRTDLGHFFFVIYAGAIFLIPFGRRGRFLKSIPQAIGAAVVVLLGAGAVHLPVYLDARARGFDQQFVGQYSNQIAYFRHEIETKILGRTFLPDPEPEEPQAKPTPKPKRETAGVVQNQPAPNPPPQAKPGRPKPAQKPQQKATATVADSSPAEPTDDDSSPEQQTRPRGGVDEFLAADSFYDRAFILAIYLPVLVVGLLVAVASVAFLRAIWLADEAVKQDSLACLLLAGAALTVFPQYFFFRPDTPHLSEFMCPFLIAMACAATVVTKAAWRSDWRVMRVPAIAFVALCIISQGIYFYHSFPKESAGTIAAKRKRSHEFVAENGVRVFVKRREAERLREMQAAIMAHAEPGDWVITYPYSPTINFMTNRPSYLYNLYVDNATAPADFTERTRREIRKLAPAVIVIDDRPINQTEASRFSNWAKGVHGFIERTYDLVGVFDTNSVYARRDKTSTSGPPQPADQP